MESALRLKCLMQVEDHGLKYFHYTFKKEALEGWFEEAMQELLKWVRYHFAWKEEKVPSTADRS